MSDGSNVMVSDKASTVGCNLYVFVKKVRRGDRNYYYLVIEEYDPRTKRKRQLLHLSIKRILEAFQTDAEGVRWCGGWDLNPRRPTPSGPQPDPPARLGHPSSTPGNHRANGVLKQRLGTSLSQTLRRRFLEWCSKSASLEVCGQYLKKLEEIDRGEREIESTRWHVTAYKRLAKMLCEEGNPRGCQEFKRIRSRKSHFDPYVPGDSEIRKAIEAPEPLGTVYMLLVESGLRLSELLRVLRGGLRAVALDGFVRVELAWYRGSKKAYWGYFLEEPPRLDVSYHRLQDLREALGLIPFKYTRKWQATQLVKLGCNDIQIDFIQGRAPENILRRNYAEILEAADNCYKRYAEWLRGWLDG